MLLQHLRKPILVATFALLVLPGAALATDNNASPHLRTEILVDAPVAAPTFVSQADCFYLEQNIPDFNCTYPLAQYAGQPDLPEKPDGVYYLFWEENVWELQGDVAVPAGDADQPGPPKTPQGVDYRFWEENYWVFADGRATFPEDAEPPRTANHPGDRGLF